MSIQITTVLSILPINTVVDEVFILKKKKLTMVIKKISFITMYTNLDRSWHFMADLADYLYRISLKKF